jgi:hypothetical protein
VIVRVDMTTILPHDRFCISLATALSATFV